ncbi:protein-L-isoaspartate O-methyltransferase [Sphingomonas sabuli]|uniref:Protein-L-isoaspartate O-methyltransferase n=1 Tax=Sphingomonas sabuli TaxID=2764186 RepID=A0A7G9L1U7_9SPHN|nr:methyltransferase domain-containing protein [Sphingomonas sabuli]QNM82596.1 protein-L-isoaspartate O-methyltransferase [Sphingomonas sabuli]
MTIHAPVPDFAAARAAMVDTQLRPEGVSYGPAVEAMGAVPRETFVAEDARPIAYTDRCVPIGHGRTMSGPDLLGKLLTELAPVAGERALVIGCGTGYACAVLVRMGVAVTGLESSAELAAAARGHGFDVVEGPLEDGWKKGAPYDLILIDGAVEDIPPAIIAQLTDRGRLGASLLDRGIGRVVVGRRAGEGFGLHTIADASAAPLPGFAKPRAFTF